MRIHQTMPQTCIIWFRCTNITIIRHFMSNLSLVMIEKKCVCPTFDFRSERHAEIKSVYIPNSNTFYFQFNLNNVGTRYLKRCQTHELVYSCGSKPRPYLKLYRMTANAVEPANYLHLNMTHVTSNRQMWPHWQVMTTSHSRSAAQEVPGVVKLKVHKSRGAQPIENESGCKSGTIRQNFHGTGCAISVGTVSWHLGVR